MSLCGELAVRRLPAYYLIDREGRLIHGLSHEAPDEATIQALLGGSRSGDDSRVHARSTGEKKTLH